MKLAVLFFAIIGGVDPGPALTPYDAVGALGFVHRLGLDPTHPNAADHEWHCTATLVKPLVVMTAAHCVTTPDAYAVRFRRRLDGGLGTIEGGVASFFHASVESWHVAATGDAALGHLVGPPVLHINYVPLLFDHGAKIGDGITLAGWGREGPEVGGGLKRRLHLCQTFLDGIGSELLSFPAPPAPGQDGCGVNSNDSGGGVVVEQGGGLLRLIGHVTGLSQATNVDSLAYDPEFSALGAPWP